MEVILLWLQLAAAAAIILVSAHFMARSADIIAEKTGLGRSFVGVVMLATATSLPELATGVSSIVLVGEADLAAGDAFGSNLFNLLIIGLLDLYWQRRAILGHVTPTSALIGVLGIIIISIAVAAMVVHGLTTATATWPVSPVSVLLFGTFLAAMYLIYRAEHHDDHSDEPEAEDTLPTIYDEESLPKAFIVYLVTAAVVAGTAIWLATTGDHLAEAMGWERSFVGTQFLALSTSLPELAASFAALRLGAPELAITNLLGSNLFNMGFVLFLDDVALTSGVLWLDVSGIHALTGVIAVIMTGIVVVGLQTRRPGRTGFPITIEAGSMIAMYVIASVLVYKLG